MTTPRVTVLSSRSDDPALDAQWSRIEKAWPFAPAPVATRLPIQDAINDPQLVTGALAVIITGKEDSNARLYKLLDELGQRRIPVALILEQGDDPLMNLASAFVFALTKDIEPEVVAGFLAALCFRQGAIDEMVKELDVARLFEGGIQSEMNRIHEELQLAATVQQQMLPSELPEAPGFDFGVLFQPCGYVSGDIYDLRRLDDRHIGFLLADVVGHGVPAALMTVALRRALTMTDIDEHGVLRIVEPAVVMERLNCAMLRGQGATSRFATAVYGVIDTQERLITLSGAGHPPPMRMQAEQGATPIVADGCLLGVFPEAEFKQTTCRLSAGEMLLLYSDGFETAFPTPETPGRARQIANTVYLDHFANLAAAQREQGMDAAIESLSQSLSAQSGSLHQIDDLTVVAIAAVEPEAPSQVDASRERLAMGA